MSVYVLGVSCPNSPSLAIAGLSLTAQRIWSVRLLRLSQRSRCPFAPGSHPHVRSPGPRVYKLCISSASFPFIVTKMYPPQPPPACPENRPRQPGQSLKFLSVCANLTCSWSQCTSLCTNGLPSPPLQLQPPLPLRLQLLCRTTRFHTSSGLALLPPPVRLPTKLQPQPQLSTSGLILLPRLRSLKLPPMSPCRRPCSNRLSGPLLPLPLPLPSTRPCRHQYSTRPSGLPLQVSDWSLHESAQL
jgi:hypothetical protein